MGVDFARHYDSVVHGDSAYFVWLNHGKRSAAIDLKSEPGSRIFVQLVASADVLVHGPGTLDRLGYSSQVLRERWPRLVTCVISGYGSSGPYRYHKAFDLLLQAESGLAAYRLRTGGAGELGIASRPCPEIPPVGG